MENNERQEILRTYAKSWNYEKKIYSFGDIRLPKAISFQEMGFLGGSILLMILVCKIIPLPPVLGYVVIPIAVTYFLQKIRFNGKTPIKWIKGWAEYIVQPKALVRFEIPDKTAAGSFRQGITFCSRKER